MLVIMLANVFILPLDIAFFSDITIQNGVLLVLSDVFCILDILLNIRTGYRDKTNGNMYELDGKKVRLFVILLLLFF